MDDSNERYFLNPESVSKHLFCSICQDVFNEPQRAPCGHSFCKQCIFRWLSQSKTCPEDRKPVSKKELHYDFILANIIGDQVVACPYRSKGCEHIGKLEFLASHQRSCHFNPINLPDFMKDDSKLSSLEATGSPCTGEGRDKLPTPSKPSLKMRLFCDENKRQLLRSVFENHITTTSLSNKENHQQQQASTNQNKWLTTKDNKSHENKRPRVISIDDSF